MDLKSEAWQWFLRTYPSQERKDTLINLYHFYLLDRIPWPEYYQLDIMSPYTPQKPILS